MKIHNYDKATGEYTGVSIADESPCEQGVFLLPACATPVSPPDTGDHEAAVFKNGAWSVLADWRGVELFSTADGSAVSISALGLTPDDVAATESQRPGAAYSWIEGAWVLVPAKAAEQLAEAKLAGWSAIKAERDRRALGGIKVGDTWYHSDLKSRCQQHDNEASGTDLVPVQWKTMDGTFVTMTADLAAKVRVARMASDRIIFSVAEEHRAAMEASSDPAAYDWSGGWPKSYGEV